MIKLTDIDGKAFYLAPRAIAQITPAPFACSRNGLKAMVLTFAGRQWGVQQSPEEILEAMAEKTLIEITRLEDPIRSFMDAATGQITTTPQEEA